MEPTAMSQTDLDGNGAHLIVPIAAPQGTSQNLSTFSEPLMPVLPRNPLVLFLDIDGVLHPEGVGADLEFYHLDNFQTVLRQFPAVRVVVSSTWRLSMSLEVLRHHFAVDIQDRIVGVTSDLRSIHPPLGLRQRECESWIERNCPGSSWLAVDDRKSYFDDDCPFLFLIPHVYDGGVGLDAEQAELLRQRLSTVLLREGPKPCADLRGDMMAGPIKQDGTT